MAKWMSRFLSGDTLIVKWLGRRQHPKPPFRLHCVMVFIRNHFAMSIVVLGGEAP